MRRFMAVTTVLVMAGLVAGDERAVSMTFAKADAASGRTLVVCPGRLDRGRYAVVDLRTRSVEAATLAQQAAI